MMQEKAQEEKREIKKYYDSLEVPEEALKRVKAGIVQAKKERRVLVMKKITRKAGMTAAAAMIVLTLMVNVSPACAEALQGIPVIGPISKVVTLRSYQDHQGNFEASAEIPHIEGSGNALDQVNAQMEAYIQSLITEYETELKEQGGDGNYSLHSEYEIVSDSEKYLSVRINTTQTIASGAQFVKIFTIDKQSGELVTLDQLFAGDPDYKKRISENLKQQMREQMAADEMKSYFIDSEVEGTDFQEISGNESFYLNERGELVICFDEYTVAPGYMGMVEFTIPESVSGKLA